jgi:hypothetical protein
MNNQKFVLKLTGRTLDNKRIDLRPSSIKKLNLENWKELTFLIRETVTKDPVAFVTFISRGKSLKHNVPQLATSGEDNFRALKFFRTFKQSPFRLVLFSSLTFLENQGVHSFLSGDGVEDVGLAHKKQIHQRIITHTKTNFGYDKSFHQIGEFPRLDIIELGQILASNKPVPEKLLPPESILRKVRAKSYAHLEFEKLGKAKYKEMRRAKMKLAR